MPYSQGPYEVHDRLPVPVRPQWGPAREINFVSGEYVVKVNGSLTHMPATAQRVVILVLNNEDNPKFNTVIERNRWVQDVRTILSPLTQENPPVIELISVTATSTAPATVEKIVKFRDLTDQSHPITEVQIP